MMKRFLSVMITAAASLALSCTSKTGSRPATFFPESGEVPGWSKTGTTRTFTADNLWEYIDGDADKYAQAGVEKTLTADYRYQNTEAVADVYVMSQPEGAQKVFNSQLATGSQAVQLGDEARLYTGSLTFRKGRYFVRLTAFQEAPDVGKALVELGRGIEEKLANAGG
jgi:hypothetical protein